MDLIKRAQKEKIISEREGQKLLSILSSPQPAIGQQEPYPSLKCCISPGGEIVLPLDSENVAEHTIFKLICSVIEPDLQKDDNFLKLLVDMILETLKMSEKKSFFYNSGNVKYEILTEIIK